MKSVYLVLLLAVSCAACDSVSRMDRDSAEPQMTISERTGREIAEAECAACHAIGRDGQSTHPEAKEFRFFSEHYPVSELAEALAQGIYVGHPDMPVFRFEPDDIDKLIDYIKSVQAPKDI